MVGPGWFVVDCRHADRTIKQTNKKKEEKKRIESKYEGIKNNQ
jgi:hypothetical protein